MILIFVAEPPIPQRVYGSVYMLQNRWFRNTFRHLPMFCRTTRSATCIRIRIQVAEWVVPQHIGRCPNVLWNHPFCNLHTDPYTRCGMGGSATKTVQNTPPLNRRSHEIFPNTLQILQ